mmetsp:Transcript_32513/g.103410  ORF Transcript_32513/g.103410 Transcript_32513/m.103410 type:complete len:109 (-) Transcript_32513:55-381(-)
MFSCGVLFAVMMGVVPLRPVDSHDWVVKNFVHWELDDLRLVAPEGEGATARGETAAQMTPGEVDGANRRLRSAMWEVVRPLLPRAAWRDGYIREASDAEGDEDGRTEL